MTNIDEIYQNLLRDILEKGERKTDRTGTGTLSVFGRQIHYDMKSGFPLLTSKKMSWKQIVVELLWFLRGDTNIRYLVENNCHIWDDDCYKKYVSDRKAILSLKPPAEESQLTWYIEWYENITSQKEFIEKVKTHDAFSANYGSLGPIYGAQWRGGLDQLQRIIDTLRSNPDSRRMLVNAWEAEKIHLMTLPPCHYAFQVYTRELHYIERYNIFARKFPVTQETVDYLQSLGDMEKHNFLDQFSIPQREISLLWSQRSVDVVLGLPFNIASYALLLMILGKISNMEPGQLIGSLGDTHIYLNHMEAVEEQLKRQPFPAPRVELVSDDWNCGTTFNAENLQIEDFQLLDYTSHPKIIAQLNT